MQSPKQPDKKGIPFRAIGIASAIGTDLVAFVFGGVYIGKWADQYFGTSPTFLLIGLLLGLVGGFYGVILMAKKFL